MKIWQLNFRASIFWSIFIHVSLIGGLYYFSQQFPKQEPKKAIDIFLHAESIYAIDNSKNNIVIDKPIPQRQDLPAPPTSLKPKEVKKIIKEKQAPPTDIKKPPKPSEPKAKIVINKPAAQLPAPKDKKLKPKLEAKSFSDIDGLESSLQDKKAVDSLKLKDDQDIQKSAKSQNNQLLDSDFYRLDLQQTNTSSVDFNIQRSLKVYQLQVIEILKKNWQPSTKMNAKEQILITAYIDNKGNLLKYSLDIKSKNEILNTQAINALLLSAPFPHLPNDFPVSKILVVPISFSNDSILL